MNYQRLKMKEMRNKTENIHRLLILAEWLKSKELNDSFKECQFVYSKSNINLMIGLNGNCYLLFPFVVEVLPVLFTEWKLNERGQITYLIDPSITNNYAILEFFGLEIWPMLHCFSIGNQQIDKYGGRSLDRLSKPHDVAENIFRYLEILPNYSDEVLMYFTRRVLIEKVNIKTLLPIKQKKKGGNHEEV